MRKLVFATNNQHKLEEVRTILDGRYQILSLKDLGDETDIPETGGTLEANAMLKAEYIRNNYGYNCFADDTGLEVEALNGAPGVYSARYAGEQKNSADNVAKLLHELQGKDNRKARFRTVIALILEGKPYLFEGEVEGLIELSPRGDAGFGYDPVFRPTGYEQTFAELSLDDKNKISHRARAVQKLASFLKEQ
jgi:XTP/dITP diphosphohydrolase